MPTTSTDRIISSFTLAYFAYWMYGTAVFYFVHPTCETGEQCVKSYLIDNTDLELHLFASNDGDAIISNAVPVYNIPQFDPSQTYTMPISMEITQRNRWWGGLLLHIIIVPKSSGEEKTYHDLLKENVRVYKIIQMLQAAETSAETFNLIADEKPQENARKVTAHFRSNVSFSIMIDDIQTPLHKIPGNLQKYFQLMPGQLFKPIITYDFSEADHKNLVQIDEKEKEDKSVDATIIYSPISWSKFHRIIEADGFVANQKSLGLSAEQSNEIKVFLTGNEYLIIGYIIFQWLHSAYHALGFDGDSAFWENDRNPKESSKISRILWRAFSRSLIFLYVSDEGYAIILGIAGLDAIREIWGLKNLVKITRNGGFFPRLKINRSDENSSDDANNSNELEVKSITRYLNYSLYPLIIANAIYSLVYQPHKSWYSWIIKSLVNGVYTSGFIAMLPQIFLNYKLKSIVYLPWQCFACITFKTIITYFWAFMIPMPDVYRIAGFREHAVFLIYLFQRCLYPVEKKPEENVTIAEEEIEDDDSISTEKSE